MSAIAGYWAFGPSDPAGTLCRHMLAAQSVYGPDATDSCAAGEIALGRNLYALLPEDAYDRQPLTGGAGRFTLVADLRLDNREEMAERIGVAPASLRETSDAGLLLQAFERLGESVLDLIVGDYAFALWDAAERRLILARDPTGQRPLYYHRGDGFFGFASMPAGLYCLPGVPRRPNQQRLADFMGLVPPVGPFSYYEDIPRVEPAHIVTVTPGETRSRRHWNPQRRTLRLPRFEDYRDAFRGEVDRAVKAQLRGAASPVASHLSSGWDSGTVTATAARLLAGRGEVVAYTSVPRQGAAPGAPFRRIPDEGALAARTAAMHSNVEHVLLPGTGVSPVRDLPRYLELFDQPPANLCNHVWLTAIREAAHAGGSNVLLTGEMGNWTLSAGTWTVLADYLREGRWAAWWREARALARARRARLRGIAASSFGPWLPRPVWNAVRRFSSRPDAAAYSAVGPAWSAYVDAARERLGGGLARRPKDRFADTVWGMTTYDFGNQRKGTLAGWGLDERDPTADRRLTEFCLSLPTEMLLKDGVRRPLAHAALSDRLPAEVLDERSKGYQAADWYEGLSADRATIARMVDAIAASAPAAAVVDVEALHRWLRDWPSAGWDEPTVMARYRSALLGALSAGMFAVAADRGVA